MSQNDYHRNELIDKASAQLKSLQDEREARPHRRHADDIRIATEIAATAFNIGKLFETLTKEQRQLTEALQKNEAKASLVRELQKGLNREYSIAVNLSIPTQTVKTE